MLVVVREQSEVMPLVRWAQRFAQARDTSLQVLYVKQGRQALACHRLPVVPEENDGDPVIQTIRSVLDDYRGERIEAADAGELNQTHKSELPGLWYAVSDKANAVVLEQVSALHVSLLVLGKTEHSKNEINQADLSQYLLRHAHCDVILVRPGSKDAQRCKHIVVPVAGGAHSMVALKLADQVARQQGAEVTALNIQPSSVEDPKALGAYHIGQILHKAGVDIAKHIHRRVETGNSVREIVNAVATEDCDLVILGTSDHGAVSRLLFGTVDSHVMAGPIGTAVAVLRRSRPLHSRVRMAIEQFAHQEIPQLNRDERIELSERIYNGSVCSFDYIALMFLATTIAALGLIQNSTAVVVGAMLVAPLMMPIIGAGLGLVQGNALLVRVASKSICFGFLVAVATGFLIGLVSPSVILTPELAGRGSPNALDLFIAFFSGIAAAYALARPNLSAALPGVAIAAALVPPIATVGISIAIGEFSNAQGAVLLFGTNVVAIIGGAALVLHLVGVRSSTGGEARTWVRRMILALFLCFIILAVPLSSVYLAKISSKEARSVEQMLTELIGAIEHSYMHDLVIEEHDGLVSVKLVVISADAVDEFVRSEIKRSIEEELGMPVQLELMHVQAELLGD